MKTFVLAAHWWGDEDIEMFVVKANSEEEVLRKYIMEQCEEEDNIRETLSIRDCLTYLEVTCSVIEVK